MGFSFIMHLICFFYFFLLLKSLLYKFINIKNKQIWKVLTSSPLNKLVIKFMMHVKYKKYFSWYF